MPRALCLSLVRGVCLSGLWLAGCTSPAAKPEDAAPQPQPVAEAKKEEAPKVEPKVEPPPPATAPATVTLATEIGVAACDDYVARYRTCIAEKVPAIEKEVHTQAVVGQMTTWLAAKADPKLAPALAGECSAAAQAARATTRVLGCVWREGDSPEPEIFSGGKPKPRSASKGLPELDF